MARRKQDDEIPILRIKKGDSLKTIYAKARKSFTAADLARFMTDEPCVPAEEVLAQLETIQRETASRTRRGKRQAIQRRTVAGRMQERKSVVSRSTIMAKRKKDADEIPILRIKKGDSLKTIYAKAQRAITAADLASFATDEPGIPAEEALARLEAVQREVSVQKPRAKRKKA